jgi:hypothetical protein
MDGPRRRELWNGRGCIRVRDCGLEEAYMHASAGRDKHVTRQCMWPLYLSLSLYLGDAYTLDTAVLCSRVHAIIFVLHIKQEQIVVLFES